MEAVAWIRAGGRAGTRKLQPPDEEGSDTLVADRLV